MKRLLWGTALSFAVAFGLGAWYGIHRAAVARADRWALQREENAAEALLDKPVKFYGKEITLAELRELVAVETGLEVTFDMEAISPLPERLPGLQGFKFEEGNWPPPDPLEYLIRLPGGTLSLRQGLAHVLTPLDLCCEARGSSLVITTHEEAASHLRTAVYPLPQPTLAKTDERDWAGLLPSLIRPEGLDNVGGAGHIEAVPGALVVVQTPSIHGRVRRLLDALGRLEFDSGSLQPRLIDTTMVNAIGDLRRERAGSALLTIAYPVHDLVLVNGRADFDPLMELIDQFSRQVSPDVWSYYGPTNVFSDRWLIVAQPPVVHEQLEAFLSRLRRGIAEGGQPLVVGAPELSPAKQRIRDALARPIALDYDNVPLDEVCSRLSSELGISVVLNAERVQEHGVRVNHPITWHLSEVPLKSQLFWMLRELDLAWMVRGESLVITPTEDAQSQLITAIYDARSLTDPDLGLPGGLPLVENLVRRLARPDSWDEVGGPGSMNDFQGLLVVTHDPEVHEELEQLLTALAAHCRPRAATAGEQLRVVRVSPSASCDRIEQALDTPISAEYCGLPLDELLRDLARRLDLPVVFDQPAVVAEGYDFKECVSISIRDRTLGSVLDELLARGQFTYELRDDVLFFTFKSRPDSQLQTRLYQVADLVQADGPSSLDQLATRISDRDALLYRQGPWLVLPMGGEWLAVSADWHTHQEVADALAEERTGQPTRRASERAERQRMLDFDRLRKAAEPDPFAP